MHADGCITAVFYQISTLPGLGFKAVALLYLMALVFLFFNPTFLDTLHPMVYVHYVSAPVHSREDQPCFLMAKHQGIASAIRWENGANLSSRPKAKTNEPILQPSLHSLYRFNFKVGSAL